MGKTRMNIIVGDYGEARVIISCKVCAKHGSEYTEDKDEIKRSLANPALSKGGKRNGDHLNAAQPEREHTNPFHRVSAAEAQKNDSRNLKGIDEKGGENNDLVLFLIILGFISHTEVNREKDHDHHKSGNEQKMLPGKIALRRSLISTKAEKFLNAHIAPLEY